MIRPESISEECWERMSWHARQAAVRRATPPKPEVERRREPRQRVAGDIQVRRMPDGWWRVSDGVGHAFTPTEAGAWAFAYLVWRIDHARGAA